ncbi:hypothetical protein N7510_002904 [Penicillium lagena]|uniref:uncharacterized protein n=1 Tax=Penicillium lagena TaxID=94218 RepID=UPI002540CD3C|nr:uncharacterized protein N7510_002904 [Penicillium lagena]KAJ5618920.1 hypothetical protein N7510_002904 [Penicillium lagena]
MHQHIYGPISGADTSRSQFKGERPQTVAADRIDALQTGSARTMRAGKIEWNLRETKDLSQKKAPRESCKAKEKEEKAKGCGG